MHLYIPVHFKHVEAALDAAAPAVHFDDPEDNPSLAEGHGWL